MSSTQTIPRDDFDRLFGHLEADVKSRIESHIADLGVAISDNDTAKQTRRLEILMEDYEADDSELELTDYLVQRGVIIPDEAMTRQRDQAPDASEFGDYPEGIE